MNPGNAPSDKVQRYIEDFIKRYQQGPQRISEQEATDRYRQVASQLPPDDYLQAAKEAFARMSPEERVQFGRYLGQEAQRQGRDFIDLNQDGIDDRLQETPTTWPKRRAGRTRSSLVCWASSSAAVVEEEGTRAVARAVAC